MGIKGSWSRVKDYDSFRKNYERVFGHKGDKIWDVEKSQGKREAKKAVRNDCR